MTTLRTLHTLATLCLVLVVAGCKSSPQPKPLNQLTAAEQSGHSVFAAQCSLCHYDRQDAALHGPSLIGLYKKPYLPSGAPANDERIANTILHGRGNMPALGGAITPHELDDLLSYLKTL